MKIITDMRIGGKKPNKVGFNSPVRLVTTKEAFVFLKEELKKHELPITKKVALKLLGEEFNISDDKASRLINEISIKSKYIKENVLSADMHLQYSRINQIPLSNWVDGVTVPKAKSFFKIQGVRAALHRLSKLGFAEPVGDKFIITEKGRELHAENKSD